MRVIQTKKFLKISSDYKIFPTGVAVPPDRWKGGLGSHQPETKEDVEEEFLKRKKKKRKKKNAE